jgi:hypothetical protein
MAESEHRSLHGDNLVDMDEFLEYYTYVSALYDNDSEFDRMISNTWNTDSNMNPSATPYAGIPKRVTKVNTKERWLNDHHRAIIGGTEFDPINPHASGYQVPFVAPKTIYNPVLMIPAGRESLPDYIESSAPREDIYAQEMHKYAHAPKQQYYGHEENKDFYNKPKAYDYSRTSPNVSGSKKRNYESPQKPKATNFPAQNQDDDVVSHHSSQSHRSERSNHSVHSNHSMHSENSIHSKRSSQKAHPQLTYDQNSSHVGQNYQTSANFYNPRPPPNYIVHKNSRYY